MKNELKQIPKRIREMREILELSETEIAKKLGITETAYRTYETETADIPISMLYEIAAIFDVDFTVLLTGDMPKMNNLCVVRKGGGVVVDRYAGYSYNALAYNFIGRTMEPMTVTLSANGEPPAAVTHAGQEFNYVLSGTVRVTVAGRENILEAGDSIYFDPLLPHKQEAVDGDASFLTVINEGKNLC